MTDERTLPRCAVCAEHVKLRGDGMIRAHNTLHSPVQQCRGSERERMPEVTGPMLRRWRESAVSDLVADRPWMAHPAAILAVLDRLSGSIR